MKLEKLTENKIRVILSLEDLEKKDLNLQDFITNAQEFQNFFIEMLDRAEKELGFVTKGCKLLIESFSSPDGIFVFTITKFSKNSNKTLTNKNKIVSVRKKTNSLSSKNRIYIFDTFEEFCSFCSVMNDSAIFKSRIKLASNISLYLYKDTYYLFISDINLKNKNLNCFYSHISEFSRSFNYTKSFEGKLLEHGKLIIKNNAISTGIKFFVKNKF